MVTSRAQNPTGAAISGERAHQLRELLADPAADLLLIEDDPGIRDTLRRVLAEEGHAVAVEARPRGVDERADGAHSPGSAPSWCAGLSRWPCCLGV